MESGDPPIEGAFTVAFQGERGAYSEQATFELLGRTSIRPVPFESFDAAFAACSNREVDLLMVPIENSLGGTIHANCDLQLQHSLFIIAEHSFRVRHSLVALPGAKMENLTKVISHPQALAQCDTFLKKRGLKPEAAYDTAGSAKLISDGKLENVGAICSELACSYYGVEVLERGIEDDSNNFTRFILLRNDPVRIAPGIECKTSIVFSLVNQTGSLFKAMSCFSMRDIDMAKIESRPCKPDIMDKLERLSWSMSDQRGMDYSMKVAMPGKSSGSRSRVDTGNFEAAFRYLFYLDILAKADEKHAANAIAHLREMTTYCRVLGSFPRGGSFSGLDNLGSHMAPLAVKQTASRKRLGILGFGTFGQFAAKRFLANDDFEVFASNKDDFSTIASNLGVKWCSNIDELLSHRLDVLVIAVSVLSFESQVRKLAERIKALSLDKRLLVVDVLSVKVHAKTTMLTLLPDCCDILCTHPMFGPESGKHSWNGLPFVFERIRLNDAAQCEDFLRWWTKQGCRMVDMSCELHDEAAASSQFITHFTGRVLARLGVQSTPINTKGFESLLSLTENTCRDSFDLFFALYKYNPNSEDQLHAVQIAMSEVVAQLQEVMRKGSE